jgi:hypothetical protein
LLVTHEDDTPDKLKGFKSSTRYGQLLGLIMGAEDEYRDVDKTDDFGPIDYDFKGAAAYIKSTGKSSRDATVWQGTSWVFRGVATIMRRQGTSEARLLRDARLRIVPVMFLGANGEVQDKGSSRGQAAVASTPNSTAPISAEAVADTLPPGTDPALVENLVRLLGVSSSHTEFMRNAVGLEGVKGDNDVTARVMDEADGPWSVKAGSKAGS